MSRSGAVRQAAVRPRAPLGTAAAALCLLAGRAAAQPPGPPSSATLAQIGRDIFFDRTLSASGQLSCAGCHDPHHAYGPVPGQEIAVGGPDMKRAGTRAVPSLRYLRSVPAFAEEHHFVDGDVGPIGGYMWDGRASSLAEQARFPLLAPNEMANASVAEVARKLQQAPYAARLLAAFGPGLFKDPERALQAALTALASFEELPEFAPATSRYDAYLRGEIELTEQEERGAGLFKDPAKGNCASCHLATGRDDAPPLFTDFDFVNVGVPRNPRLPANADRRYYDLGLCGPLRTDLTAHLDHCGFFRAPTLRNVAIRKAFFHNGVFTSLTQVLEFYNERDLHPEKFYPHGADGQVRRLDDLPPGFPDNTDHDPPLDRKPGAGPALSPDEIQDIIAFLGTLTDADVQP